MLDLYIYMIIKEVFVNIPMWSSRGGETSNNITWPAAIVALAPLFYRINT